MDIKPAPPAAPPPAVVPAEPAPEAGKGPIQCKSAGRPTLAVLDLSVSGFPPGMSGLFNDALRGELINSGCFRVQDRAQMQEVLKTQQQNASELCDESCAVQAGRLLQVALLASGRVVKSESGAWTVVTITEVETGTTLKSVRLKAPQPTGDAVMESLPQLARQLAE